MSVHSKVISHPFLKNNSEIMGHSGSLWLTDGAFLQIHVTFCEYLVFHELKQNFRQKYYT